MSSITKSRMSLSEYKRLTSAKKPKAAKPRDNGPWDQRYKSTAETVFAEIGWREFGDYLRSQWGDEDWSIVDVLYEPYRLRLPGGWYKPAFVLRIQHHPDGSSQCWRAVIEVKATRYQPSYRDSRSKIRAAAAIHTWDRFFVAWYEKGCWRFEEIQG